MILRGLMRRPAAPIWAWHSCGAIGRAPDQETVDAFSYQNSGLVIEFEAPCTLVLLSLYGPWNDFIYECWDHHNDVDHVERSDRRWQQMFLTRIPRRPPWLDCGNHYDIQAVVPYMRLEWVKDTWPFKISDWIAEMYRGTRTHELAVDGVA